MRTSMGSGAAGGPVGAGAAGAPLPRGVPVFAPIRAGGARGRLRRGLRKGRRAVAAGLAVTAAVLAASVPGGAAPPPAAPLADRVTAAAADTARATARPARVRVPVRIADAGAVALLRPGDRVDVLAAARVVAAGAPVVSVPAGNGEAFGDGALVVLSVPRSAAAALAGAATRSPLMVALL